MTLKELASHIRTYRGANNLTQIQFAKLADVNPALISRIESGRTENPNYNTINSICNALDISYAELFPVKSKDLTVKETETKNDNDLNIEILQLKNKLKKSQELVNFLISQQ